MENLNRIIREVGRQIQEEEREKEKEEENKTREEKEKIRDEQTQRIRKELAAAMRRMLEFEYQNRVDDFTRKGLNCITHLEFNFEKWKEKETEPNSFTKKMNIHFRIYALMIELEQC